MKQNRVAKEQKEKDVALKQKPKKKKIINTRLIDLTRNTKRYGFFYLFGMAIDIFSLRIEEKIRLINYLSQYKYPSRLRRFEEILEQRTRYITVVLEDIYKTQNSSAVMRTAECLGIQDVHIIENKHKHMVHPHVAAGSLNWLTLQKYNTQDDNTLLCFSNLRANGYKIICVSPHENDITLNDINILNKTAFVFGTEKFGLSKTAMQHADAFLKIPMYGFTESYNISVSASIVLYNAIQKIRNANLNWKLSYEEKLNITLEWIKTSLKNFDLLVLRFFTMHGE